MPSKTRRTRAQWAAMIRGLQRKTAQSLIAIGRALTQAKREIGHGQWLAMLETDLKIRPRLAQHLMQLASSPAFAKTSNLTHLPTVLSALAELAEAPEDIIDQHIKTGAINPSSTARQVRVLFTTPAPSPPQIVRVPIRYTTIPLLPPAVAEDLAIAERQHADVRQKRQERQMVWRAIDLIAAGLDEDAVTVAAMVAESPGRDPKELTTRLGGVVSFLTEMLAAMEARAAPDSSVH